MLKRRFAMVGLFVCLGLFFLSGCFSAHSTVKHTGSMVGNETLRRIEPGKTSKEWLLSVLGKPTASGESGEGTELLKYESVTSVTSRSSWLLGRARETKSTRQTHYFEIKSGIVTKHWEESVEVRKTSDLE